MGHHCTVYSVVMLGCMPCLGCLEGQSSLCIIATGVWWARLGVLWRRGVICGIESVGLFVCGLARLVRPLVVTCTGCIVVVV